MPRSPEKRRFSGSSAAPRSADGSPRESPFRNEEGRYKSVAAKPATDTAEIHNRWKVATAMVLTADPGSISESRRNLFLPPLVAGDVHALRARLAECPEERMNAAALWRAAKLAEDQYERSIRADFQRAKRDAAEMVEGRKTNEKIDAAMRDAIPEQMSRWEKEQAELHAVTRLCEQLHDQWKKQPQILESLIIGLAGKN